jgi:hypothetical protein
MAAVPVHSDQNDVSGLGDEAMYDRLVAFLKGECDQRDVAEFLRSKGFEDRTVRNYLSDLQNNYELRTSSCESQHAEEILVDRRSGLEIVPDHRMRSRLASAFAHLEYDVSFDASKASISDLSKKASGV